MRSASKLSLASLTDAPQTHRSALEAALAADRSRRLAIQAAQDSVFDVEQYLRPEAREQQRRQATQRTMLQQLVEAKPTSAHLAEEGAQTERQRKLTTGSSAQALGALLDHPSFLRELLTNDGASASPPGASAVQTERVRRAPKRNLIRPAVGEEEAKAAPTSFPAVFAVAPAASSQQQQQQPLSARTMPATILPRVPGATASAPAGLGADPLRVFASATQAQRRAHHAWQRDRAAHVPHHRAIVPLVPLAGGSLSSRSLASAPSDRSIGASRRSRSSKPSSSILLPALQDPPPVLHGSVATPAAPEANGSIALQLFRLRHDKDLTSGPRSRRRRSRRSSRGRRSDARLHSDHRAASPSASASSLQMNALDEMTAHIHSLQLHRHNTTVALLAHEASTAAAAAAGPAAAAAAMVSFGEQKEERERLSSAGSSSSLASRSPPASSPRHSASPSASASAVRVLHNGRTIIVRPDAQRSKHHSAAVSPGRSSSTKTNTAAAALPPSPSRQRRSVLAGGARSPRKSTTPKFFAFDLPATVASTAAPPPAPLNTLLESAPIEVAPSVGAAAARARGAVDPFAPSAAGYYAATARALVGMGSDQQAEETVRAIEAATAANVAALQSQMSGNSSGLTYVLRRDSPKATESVPEGINAEEARAALARERIRQRHMALATQQKTRQIQSAAVVSNTGEILSQQPIPIAASATAAAAASPNQPPAPAAVAPIAVAAKSSSSVSLGSASPSQRRQLRMSASSSVAQLDSPRKKLQPALAQQQQQLQQQQSQPQLLPGAKSSASTASLAKSTTKGAAEPSAPSRMSHQHQPHSYAAPSSSSTRSSASAAHLHLLQQQALAQTAATSGAASSTASLHSLLRSLPSKSPSTLLTAAPSPGDSTSASTRTLLASLPPHVQVHVYDPCALLPIASHADLSKVLAKKGAAAPEHAESWRDALAARGGLLSRDDNRLLRDLHRSELTPALSDANMSARTLALEIEGKQQLALAMDDSFGGALMRRLDLSDARTEAVQSILSTETSFAQQLAHARTQDAAAVTAAHEAHRADWAKMEREYREAQEELAAQSRAAATERAAEAQRQIEEEDRRIALADEVARREFEARQLEEMKARALELSDRRAAAAERARVAADAAHHAELEAEQRRLAELARLEELARIAAWNAKRGTARRGILSMRIIRCDCLPAMPPSSKDEYRFGVQLRFNAANLPSSHALYTPFFQTDAVYDQGACFNQEFKFEVSNAALQKMCVCLEQIPSVEIDRKRNREIANLNYAHAVAASTGKIVSAATMTVAQEKGGGAGHGRQEAKALYTLKASAASLAASSASASASTDVSDTVQAQNLGIPPQYARTKYAGHISVPMSLIRACDGGILHHKFVLEGCKADAPLGDGTEEPARAFLEVEFRLRPIFVQTKGGGGQQVLETIEHVEQSLEAEWDPYETIWNHTWKVKEAESSDDEAEEEEQEPADEDDGELDDDSADEAAAAAAADPEALAAGARMQRKVRGEDGKAKRKRRRRRQRQAALAAAAAAAAAAGAGASGGGSSATGSAPGGSLVPSAKASPGSTLRSLEMATASGSSLQMSSGEFNFNHATSGGAAGSGRGGSGSGVASGGGGGGAMVIESSSGGTSNLGSSGGVSGGGGGMMSAPVVGSGFFESMASTFDDDDDEDGVSAPSNHSAAPGPPPSIAAFLDAFMSSNPDDEDDDERAPLRMAAPSPSPPSSNAASRAGTSAALTRSRDASTAASIVSDAKEPQQHRQKSSASNSARGSRNSSRRNTGGAGVLYHPQWNPQQQQQQPTSSDSMNPAGAMNGSLPSSRRPSMTQINAAAVSAAAVAAAAAVSVRSPPRSRRGSVQAVHAASSFVPTPPSSRGPSRRGTAATSSALHRGSFKPLTAAAMHPSPQSPAQN